MLGFMQIFFVNETMASRSSLHLLSPLLVMALSAPAHAASGCAGYAGELKVMVEIADAARSRVDYLAAPGDLEAAQRRDELETAERANAERLGAWLSACGWPRRSVEGPEASRNAWLVAQQRRADLPFQRQVVRQLELAVLDGEAPAMHLASASDRLAVQERRPQRYGTQLRQAGACGWDYYELDDLARVEARRKRLRLPPLEEHRRAINAMAAAGTCLAAPPDATSTTR
jgi:hypothetical protein